MRTRHQTPYPVGMVRLCAALWGLASAVAAHAEAPMHTDDAGTLGQGAMKLEAGIGRDGKTRGASCWRGRGCCPTWKWKFRVRGVEIKKEIEAR